MKMFFRNLSIAACVVTLASCGADGTKISDSGEKVAGSSASSAETKTKSFRKGDVIQLGDYVITVTKIVDPAPATDEFMKPDAGKKFVAIEVLYENRTSDKTLDYNPYDWKITDSESYTYDPDAIGGKSPTLEMGTINPGQKTRGWLNFQTPRDAQSFKAQFQPNWLSNENVLVEL
jgi:predicted small lipoprotein YifL